MSIQLLVADLSALVSETKRKNADIRHAADKSLDILKNSQGKDEKTFLRSLSQNADFINPILLACQSKNAKLTGIALQCLSRLIMTHSLPVTKIDLIIDALLESTHSSIDIQLKILQLLPSFFQSYSLFIADDSLSKLLLVCSSLQSTNRMGAVINTAQATFLQLVNLAFEKVHDEDKRPENEQTFQVPVGLHETKQIAACAYDAQRIVNDLCTLIEHHKPAFLKTNYITEDFGFELLESIVKNNKGMFLSHQELSHLLRIRVAPILLRFLSSSKDFTVMVRVSRLISLLIHEQFQELKIESEVTMSLLTHTLAKESASPAWKRILALEIYRSLFKDFNLVADIFAEYDDNRTEERKHVLDEFLKECLQIVTDGGSLLNTGDLVQTPLVSTPEPATQPASKQKKPSTVSQSASTRQEDKTQGLSVSKSSIKFAYIDSLDKADPPQAPDTYVLYLVSQTLISFCEGICNSTLDLARDGETVSFLDETTFTDKQKKDKYELLKNMVLFNWKNLLELHKNFVYSSLDTELFSKTLRSLQKLCHASGILSLKDIRNEILNFFAISTLKLTGKEGHQNRFLSFGESIVGTISLTIGNAVSNMSHPAPPESDQIQLYTRNINPRQIMCFRVLISLATSLGAVLEENWDIIFITLQWVSYYLDGPSDLKVKEIPPLPSSLSDTDLGFVESTLKKLTESIKAQSKDVFNAAVKSLIRLSDTVIKTSLTAEDKRGLRPVYEGKLEPSIFNKSFFINKLTDICEISPVQFLIESDENWSTVVDFCTNTAKDRDLEDNLRLMITRNFNTITKSAAVTGFDSNVEATQSETEKKILNALNNFIETFAKLPISSEILITNCEVEVQLLTLNTLKDIVDQYGTSIKHHWGVITQMLNSPFEIIGNVDTEMLQERPVTEIIISVLRSTFETLKVILDTVLQSIAKDQIKAIIDCLYNFVSQRFNLNISFNSISYFWLISDYLKEKIESGEKSSVETEKPLGSSEWPEKFETNESLWIYMIYQLSRTTADPRTQVRNGSIQTFFNIIDSYGSLSPSWKLIYDITLSPIIMTIPSSDNLSGEWVESFTLIVNGLTKLYSQYLTDFTDKATIEFWSGLLEFFTKLTKVEPTFTELNLQVFKAFESLVVSVGPNPPKELIETLYSFWAGFQISYNLSNDSLYQSSLCAFISAFDALFKVLAPVLTLPKFELILTMLNSCIRYPILIGASSDTNKCTELQNQVISSLSSLSFDDPKYESLLIQQLNLIVILPFSTRDLIHKKLGARDVKIPTFIAASYEALQLLKQHLYSIKDLTFFLNDRCLIKVYKALLEPSKLKSPVYQSNGHCLWMESMDILVHTSENIHLLLSNENSVKDDIKLQLSPLLLETFKTSFGYSMEEVEGYEEFDLEKYEQMKNCLIPLFSTESIGSRGNVEEFMVTVWTSSFLYVLDDVENSILESSKSPSEVSAKLCEYDLDLVYGSTAELSKMPRLKLAKSCLEDLISFSFPSENNTLFEKALPYFISRCAFALRKLLSDERLLYKQPLPKIQQIEINTVLNGLMSITDALDKVPDSEPIYSKLMVLFPLLVQAIAVKTDTNQLMQKLTIKLGKKH
ncbi:hypothetical protein OGAPHI_000281 [Ogataea philodendri]|uniref:Protein MON2 n=1 Tax=Ogataea philodendri TaxID=1378263 RepID=A0A9P8PFZ4_9ASCO|nr:uncharacterized protein OGAPHI_000281 [Ogataea philodendri]KAH3671578.1 hypothetical protein OGAPHI_000281 [Ogataea philodendri]